MSPTASGPVGTGPVSTDPAGTDPAGTDPVAAVADAVLYEGYLLWPYRRGTLKNQQRWTIGGVYPPAYSEQAGTGDRCVVQAEWLVETDDPGATGITVSVRFLQVVDRQVRRDGQPVDELTAGGRRYQTWQEAREQQITVPAASLAELASTRHTPLRVPAGNRTEPIDGSADLHRSWRHLEGEVETTATPVAPGASRLTVRLCNTTPASGTDRDAAVRATLVCAHLIARTDTGRFVSSTDPPAHLREAVERCDNSGLWPVLGGEPGDRHTVLAAPIVLYDWPRVAPESPGDLFDGTEIDQLLILNVLSLTPAEQEEMAAADPRARRILERCAALSPEQLLRLGGTLRDPRRDVW